MSQLMKKAIRESFIKLVNEMPFDKITVKDIVEDCGVSRNTFYYHYQDIYDLLREIFETETASVLESRLEYDSWQEAFLQATAFALDNRKGIYHIYNSIKRKEIEDYLHKITGKIMTDFVKKQAEGINAKEEDILLIAQFYECALVGLMQRWLDGGMKEDPEYIINRMGVMLDRNITAMLEKSLK
ncbi:TetR/AcrR family transcriptional regulator [Ruminococcus sp. 5_1_39BFAA]|uniref:TetR/AcrR family transcriptional regulator n=1 Tax=Ruminococcus sp. 5_1_39BFAA TaxID=457412 RepID=UPI00356592F7